MNGKLARDLAHDPHMDGVGYARATSKNIQGDVDRLVIIAEGETARELLPLVDNFEALMDKPVSVEVQS